MPRDIFFMQSENAEDDREDHRVRTNTMQVALFMKSLYGSGIT